MSGTRSDIDALREMVYLYATDGSLKYWKHLLQMGDGPFGNLVEELLEKGVIDHCETTKEAKELFAKLIREQYEILCRLEGREPYRILRFRQQPLE